MLMQINIVLHPASPLLCVYQHGYTLDARQFAYPVRWDGSVTWARDSPVTHSAAAQRSPQWGEANLWVPELPVLLLSRALLPQITDSAWRTLARVVRSLGSLKPASLINSRAELHSSYHANCLFILFLPLPLFPPLSLLFPKCGLF